MFAQLNVYKNLIVGGVVLLLGLYFYIHSLKSEIVNLNNMLKDNQIELANAKLQSNRYKSAIDMQNVHIEQLELNEKLANAKLRKWKNSKPEVKYRTITKIREVKSDDCKKIKEQLDIVKHTNFNSL
jgi:hypothetical protein